MAFGIFTFSNPEISIKLLILIIEIALLISGIVRILNSISNKDGKKGNQIIKLATAVAIPVAANICNVIVLGTSEDPTSCEAQTPGNPNQ